MIMATGGFGRDIEYRMMQLPELNNDLDSTNHPGATSEALKQMMLLGANPIHLDQIQLGPWASPDEKGFGTASQFNTIATYPHGIVVDVRTGERFFNELADRKARADAIMTRRDEHNNPVYPIGFTNAEGAKNAQTLDWGIKYKVITKPTPWMNWPRPMVCRPTSSRRRWPAGTKRSRAVKTKSLVVQCRKP